LESIFLGVNQSALRSRYRLENIFPPSASKRFEAQQTRSSSIKTAKAMTRGIPDRRPEGARCVQAGRWAEARDKPSKRANRAKGRTSDNKNNRSRKARGESEPNQGGYLTKKWCHARYLPQDKQSKAQSPTASPTTKRPALVTQIPQRLSVNKPAARSEESRARRRPKRHKAGR
jgi:hypothetical protein